MHLQKVLTEISLHRKSVKLVNFQHVQVPVYPMIVGHDRLLGLVDDLLCALNAPPLSILLEHSSYKRNHEKLVYSFFKNNGVNNPHPSHQLIAMQ